MTSEHILADTLRILDHANYKISSLDKSTKALATDKRYKVCIHSLSLNGFNEIATAILSYKGKKMYFYHEYIDGNHKKVIESY